MGKTAQPGDQKTIMCPFQTSLQLMKRMEKSIPPLNGSLNTVFPRQYGSRLKIQPSYLGWTSSRLILLHPAGLSL